ncbi:MAG: protein kinase [Pyrinomonadaceae bacterium]|nr:protein kinase [Pyrinomonadaceae bacterium]
MTPARWQHIDELFHAASELAPEDRAHFLREACSGDDSLRVEVESLISAHEQSTEFLDVAAYEIADVRLGHVPAMLAVGQSINHYKILGTLGVGGMSEVYLAQDTKLDRRVALKILPAEYAADKDRMRRFEQEAKSAAALNHPHIAHIYEIGEAEGKQFISMEYVEGETLRSKIHREKTELPQLVKYLTQVAAGLAKAHECGIVHRDLKPDNIMITRDGDAKILDFGLSKLIGSAKPRGDGDDVPSEDAAARISELSTPGMVMGTVGYMSPEQAQGKVREIDHRSDIFSFGCILYEAATGLRAFGGKDVLDSLHKIVYAPTPQIKDSNAAAPEELQKIVRRCLAKEPERRYQTTRDVANDLEDLRRALESKTKHQRSVVPSANGTTTVRIEKPIDNGITSGPATPTEISTAQSVSSVRGELNQQKRIIAISALVTVLVASGYGLYKFLSKENPELPFREMRMTKLTSTSKTDSAAISPDGKYVVFVLVDGEKQSLWLKHVATMSDAQIVPTAEVRYSVPTFSPDGDFVYYIKSQPNDLTRVLYRVAVLGGPSIKVTEGIAPTGLAVSPDGKQLAFLRGSSLRVANVDGTGERELISHDPNLWFGALAWSAEGKSIFASVGNYTEEAFYMNVVSVSTVGGAERAISSQWPGIQSLASLRDGTGLLMSAWNKGATSNQIWQLSDPTGEARRITNDLNDYFGVSLTTDSTALVTIQSQTTSNIWIMPNGDEGSVKQIVPGGKHPSWSPDGVIAYASGQSGKQDLWFVKADGTDQKQVSFDSTYYSRPMVTPDNHYIIFMFSIEGRPFIGRMDRNGSNLKPLTSDLGGSRPFHMSPDGKWVIYSDTKRGGLWRVSIDGGYPHQLTSNYLQFAPAVSPDGKLIACYQRDSPGDSPKIAIIPFNGGDPIKILDLSWPRDLTERFVPPLRWAADGRAVTYVNARGDVFNIWSQPLDGRPPKQLTHFTSDQIFSFDWSGDGNQLALARGTTTRDAILISNLNR